MAMATAPASSRRAFPPAGLFANLLSEGVVIWRYLAAPVFPRGQSIVHEVDWATSLLHPAGLSPLLAIVASLALAVCAAAPRTRWSPSA